jgi:hypothetical protein
MGSGASTPFSFKEHIDILTESLVGAFKRHSQEEAEACAPKRALLSLGSPVVIVPVGKGKQSLAETRQTIEQIQFVNLNVVSNRDARRLSLTMSIGKSTHPSVTCTLFPYGDRYFVGNNPQLSLKSVLKTHD